LVCVFTKIESALFGRTDKSCLRIFGCRVKRHECLKMSEHENVNENEHGHRYRQGHGQAQEQGYGHTVCHYSIIISPSSQLIGILNQFRHCVSVKSPCGPSSIPNAYCSVQPCTVQWITFKK
jgi:hypothetical protein